MATAWGTAPRMVPPPVAERMLLSVYLPRIASVGMSKGWPGLVHEIYLRLGSEVERRPANSARTV